jgi:hypothetical protein
MTTLETRRSRRRAANIITRTLAKPTVASPTGGAMLCGCAHSVLNHSSAVPTGVANASNLRGERHFHFERPPNPPGSVKAPAGPIEPSSLCKRTKISTSRKMAMAQARITGVGIGKGNGKKGHNHHQSPPPPPPTPSSSSRLAWGETKCLFLKWAPKTPRWTASRSSSERRQPQSREAAGSFFSLISSISSVLWVSFLSWFPLFLHHRLQIFLFFICFRPYPLSFPLSSPFGSALPLLCFVFLSITCSDGVS